ncbi:C4-dicarboxylate ABC transporter [Nitrosomonas supralitoralis]|uniref:C4-dicarboxylate ABC transporter n=1 Tax=Nitrosomonas supralitoralis TaxID=2116706 RepID=A0A2P7NWC1_9PROT|nr:C4-dicarboxylate ABC transporter [Nitrosomonas supralitoralis]PSJ17766.1 C4-dicarboxylate ABC transporter [Nitrosomonas supralitoralis]
MKTSQIFAISAVVITATFFGILSVFDLPESMTQWVISDIILGAILYINYLVIVMLSNTSKTRTYYPSKKVIA